MNNRVFVLNSNKSPLRPCTPKRARKILESGKAAIFRRFPFTLILKAESENISQPLTLKSDPGSKTTGLALVLKGKTGLQCIWGAELTHRGLSFKLKLLTRRALRTSRWNHKLRHRPARFLNRTRPAGWLPPSLMHRVLTITSWARRLDRWTPLDAFSMELVSFDLQKMINADIQRQEHQQGTLFGTEVRAYLRQKWKDCCAYCDRNGEEVEHLTPRSRGGTNRISNLVWSCRNCNTAKGTLTLEEFLVKKPAVLKNIQAQQQAALHDSAAVDATKDRLLETLQTFGSPVETGSGAQTSFNRSNQGYDKAHWIDAACVGDKGERVAVPHLRPLLIRCMGRGTRQMCGTDRFVFPVRHRTQQKVFFGFQTGTMVRVTGSFKLPQVDGLHHRFFKALHKGDGYGFTV